MNTIMQEVCKIQMSQHQQVADNPHEIMHVLFTVKNYDCFHVHASKVKCVGTSLITLFIVFLNS